MNIKIFDNKLQIVVGSDCFTFDEYIKGSKVNSRNIIFKYKRTSIKDKLGKESGYVVDISIGSLMETPKGDAIWWNPPEYIKISQLIIERIKKDFQESGNDIDILEKEGSNIVRIISNNWKEDTTMLITCGRFRIDISIYNFGVKK